MCLHTDKANAVIPSGGTLAAAKGVGHWHIVKLGIRDILQVLINQLIFAVCQLYKRPPIIEPKDIFYIAKYTVLTFSADIAEEASVIYYCPAINKIIGFLEVEGKLYLSSFVEIVLVARRSGHYKTL